MHQQFYQKQTKITLINLSNKQSTLDKLLLAVKKSH